MGSDSRLAFSAGLPCADRASWAAEPTIATFALSRCSTSTEDGTVSVISSSGHLVPGGIFACPEIYRGSGTYLVEVSGMLERACRGVQVTVHLQGCFERNLDGRDDRSQALPHYRDCPLLSPKIFTT